jgi:hypothetical protein
MNESEMFYQVSYVVLENKHPGAIATVDSRPVVGDIVRFGGHSFEILEVAELTEPVVNFSFLHVTCRMLEST